MKKTLNGMKKDRTFKNYAVSFLTMPITWQWKKSAFFTRIWARGIIFIFSLVIISTSAYPIMDPNLSEDARLGSLERYVKFQRLSVEIQSYAMKFSGKLGIVIKDLQTKQSIEINSSNLFPSASLVKLPIMAAYFQAERDGKIDLSGELTLKKRHKARPKTAIYRMRAGSKIGIKDLIEAMITESDNTATNMLVEAIGFKYLNKGFAKFGLSKTDIRRGIMDLRKRNRGVENFTTPKDMAFFLESIYRGELVSSEASREMLKILKRQKINDRIPVSFPESIVIAHKTGLLSNAVSDVGIVFTRKGDFIICILTSEITSTRKAKKVIRRIAEYAYDLCYRSEI
ncbi:MAG: class A beta-lactamase-related serine hydrolase [Elusimicrobia bacterium]|nr:class A beta-lactamase-related serine hydrolase [Elusimicrobiota bacterium]